MKSKVLFLLLVCLFGATSLFSSCSKDDDEEIEVKTDYDVLKINGTSYACYGYRCAITYTTEWNLSTHSGEISLPCGKLSDAQKEEYDIDYMYTIYLSGKEDLKEGSKLQDFNPRFQEFGEWTILSYESGSATITDKSDDRYLTIKFDSFSFAKDSKSYVLDGTVQLDLDED